MAKIKLRRSKFSNPSQAVAARPLNLWQDKEGDSEARIEIVPLIDVIFCILVFFLLSSLQFSRQQAIGLQLPQASTGTNVVRDTKLVTLDDRGLIYEEGNSNPISKDTLRQSLITYSKTNPKGLMVLHASRSVTYNEVIQVLDILKSVGGDRVALATLPGESQSNSTVTPDLNNLPDSGSNTNTIPYLNNNTNSNTGNGNTGNTNPNLNNNGSIDLSPNNTTPNIPTLPNSQKEKTINNNATPKQGTVKPTVPPAPQSTP